MQDYNFVLDYIPGKTNMVADVLSHREDLNEGVSTKKQILLPDSLFRLHKICFRMDKNNNENESLFTQKIFLKDDPDKR